MMDGTEYGGMVTVRNTDGSVEGPTWHGMLSRRILQPDAGKDYLTVSGNAATILNTLFKRIGLDSLFTADASTVTIGGWQFDRYTDAYTGVTKMLTANNAKLRLTWLDGHVHAIAKPVDHYGDTIDSDLLVFQASLDSQPVNHLIGLGQGDLHERVVVHWYADSNGKVQPIQDAHRARGIHSHLRLQQCPSRRTQRENQRETRRAPDTGRHERHSQRP